jgi:hypothetical protein
MAGNLPIVALAPLARRMPGMRRAVIIATAAILLLAATAQAATSLPGLLARQIRSVNARAHAPAVLLPRTMPLDAKRLYAAGGATKSGYDLLVGAAPNCGDADACFVADFSAAKGTRVFGSAVKVHGASRAGFFPLSCGGSCSPPQIDFIVHGVRYTIQANLNTKRGDRATLIAAAQSAIAAGPR